MSPKPIVVVFVYKNDHIHSISFFIEFKLYTNIEFLRLGTTYKSVRLLQKHYVYTLILFKPLALISNSLWAQGCFPFV